MPPRSRYLHERATVLRQANADIADTCDDVSDAGSRVTARTYVIAADMLSARHDCVLLLVIS